MNSEPHNGFAQLQLIARNAMTEHGLEPDFPPAAMAQAEALAGSPHGARSDASVRSAVRDLRDLLWVSIDNDDSRDLDQLSVAQPRDDGGTRILVAIADVDALVKRDSPLDRHASTNTTSVYTAARIFPLLPESLSTDLTSLGQDQDRLSIVVAMTVDDAGAVSQADIFRAQVRNRAKLAYRSVAAWLDGKAPAPQPVSAVRGVQEQLQIQDRVAQALKRARQQRGSLTLQTLEARPLFEAGRLLDLKSDDKNRAAELIEEFMVAANGVVARYLQARSLPSLRRILRSPQKWDRIVELARQAGGSLPTQPDAVALAAFLMQRRQADPLGFADLSLAVVKLLGAGEYVVEVPGQPAEGHFGLAVQDYTHATAPNRRFPDLISQRLIKGALDGGSAPYGVEELRHLAAHCTLQEGNAAKVERRVRKSAAAMLLADRIGQHFQAVVTGASDKGTWVRIQQPIAEGKLVSGSVGLDVGDRIGVTLLHADVARGFIDFAARENA